MNKFLNQIKIAVRWADIDAYQHLGNQHYFEYMMEARAQFFKKHLSEIKHHFVLVDTRCNFKKPFYYGETVLVKQYLLSIGNSSFELQYAMSFPETPDVIHAEGYAKLVCVDPLVQKTIRVPEEIKALLGGK